MTRHTATQPAGVMKAKIAALLDAYVAARRVAAAAAAYNAAVCIAADAAAYRVAEAAWNEYQAALTIAGKREP